MEKLNITRGNVTCSPQKGEFDKCFQAQVWSNAGISLAIFEPSINPEVSSDNAKLYVDAHNTYMSCQFRPSELKAQKEELLEACKMMMKKYPYADGMMEIAELIQKYKSNE